MLSQLHDRLEEFALVRKASLAWAEERIDALRERYQEENVELRALIGQSRRAMRDVQDYSPDSLNRLQEVLSLPIPGPRRPT